jgi:hypothetical protein
MAVVLLDEPERQCLKTTGQQMKLKTGDITD